jgi:GNAT superfamily N-acetyltransferase
VVTVTYTPLTAERLADYLHFFETRAFIDNPRWAGCYCYYPLHDPNRIKWASRSAGENRAAVTECIRAGTARGVLAYLDGEVVGWCSAGPWSQFPMLQETPEPDADRLGAVFCFVVAPELRGHGVATGLLTAACDFLRAQGLQAVRAKPVRAATGAAANHLGPLALYLKSGFRILREEGEHIFVERKLA